MEKSKNMKYINRYLHNNIKRQLFKILKGNYILQYINDKSIYVYNEDEDITSNDLLDRITSDVATFKKNIKYINVPNNKLKKYVNIKYGINIKVYNLVNFVKKLGVDKILLSEYQLLNFISTYEFNNFINSIYYIV